MNLVVLLSLAFVLQGRPIRESSAGMITSSDPYTRQMEDRMSLLLEAQNEKEMASDRKTPPPNKQEMAMLASMNQQLEKLTAAVEQKSYKDIDSLSGKLVSSVKFFVPEIEKLEKRETGILVPEGIGPVFQKLGPGIGVVIKGLREGVLNLRIAAEVVSQLRSVQQAAKQGKKKTGSI